MDGGRVVHSLHNLYAFQTYGLGQVAFKSMHTVLLNYFLPHLWHQLCLVVDQLRRFIQK